MKFSRPTNNTFFSGLKTEVNAYFGRNDISRYANGETLLKALLLIAAYIGAYAGIFVFQDYLPGLLGAYVLLGFAGVMLVFNIVHDASHHALFRRRGANNAVRYLGDLVGINTYIWDIRHNVQHHSFTNVLGGDLIIENIPLIRLSPHQPHRRFHRFQMWYAPLLYMFYSFYWMFVIDFRLFLKKDICNLKDIRHSRFEWAVLFGFKAFYVGYMILVPALFTSLGIVKALLLFLLMHAAAGLLLSIVAVLGHFVDGPSFPEAAAGLIQSSWSEHELEATIDFAPRSRIVNWITGGLNTHVAHHLFPGICHAHYRKLTAIIEAYCVAHGYPYKKETLAGALSSHFRYLKKLSRP